MANVTISRGPWVIDTTLITLTSRLGVNSFAVVANGVGYFLTLSEATQLGVQNAVPPGAVNAGVTGALVSLPPNTVFAGLIRQAGTAAPSIPTAFLDQINFANATPARTSAGLYTFTLTGAFPASKVYGIPQIVGGATGFIATLERTSADVMTLRVFDAAGAAADLVGDVYLIMQIWP